MQCWAQRFGIYFVSAIDAELGMIVDQSGKVLAEATYEAVITRRINLDRRVLHMDYNWGRMDEMLAKYGTGISFEYFTREAKYAIASERDDLTVDDLIREFELETLDEYWARVHARRARALREAQGALARTAADLDFLRDAIDRAPVLAWSQGPDGQIGWANAAYRDRFDGPAGELPDHRIVMRK